REPTPLHPSRDSTLACPLYFSCYQLRRGLQEMNKASVKIQAAWRGYQVRRELDEMNKAAVKIQAAYRSHRTPGYPYATLQPKAHRARSQLSRHRTALSQQAQ
uniref:Uncharacterized protein n=1 Tax=Gallus gallus TaxID=9031 RepID=A0A8V0YCP7_CHICK